MAKIKKASKQNRYPSDLTDTQWALLALFELLGETTPITSTGESYGEKPTVASLATIPEPTQRFVISKIYDDAGEIEIESTRRFVWTGFPRKFSFVAGPNEIKQLQSLAYLLSSKTNQGQNY